MVRIWGQFGFYLNFSIFCHFGSLGAVLVRKTSLECIGKLMDGYLTFLSSFQCILSQFQAPKLGEKALCQLEKNISTCVILDLAQNAL